MGMLGLFMFIDILIPIILIFLFQQRLLQLIKSYFISIKNFQNTQKLRPLDLNTADLKSDDLECNQINKVHIGDSLKYMEPTHSIISLQTIMSTNSANPNAADPEIPRDIHLNDVSMAAVEQNRQFDDDHVA